MIQIFTTSDLHGHLLREPSEKNSENSLAQLASIIHERQLEKEHRIYIDNGDTIQGTPLTHYYGNHDGRLGHPVVKALEVLGCDAVVPGNHEFNYGLQRINRVVDESTFPWLSANILYRKTQEPYFGQPYLIREAGSVRVAILGITTCVMEISELDVEMVDEVTALARWIAVLEERETYDLLVVAYHGGVDHHPSTGMPLVKAHENLGLTLFEKFPQIDVLITGHQHLSFSKTMEKRVILQPPAFAEGLGEVLIALEKESGDSAWSVSSVQSMIHLTNGREEAQTLVRALLPYWEEADAWKKEVLCTLQGDMLVSDILKDICLASHPLVEWLHRVQIKNLPSDISCVTFPNATFKGFHQGTITREDVMNFFPFPGTLEKVNMTGKDLRVYLEHAASLFQLDEHSGSVQFNPVWLEPHFRLYDYPMLHGIDYTFDLRKPEGSRVVQASVSGEKLNDDKRYTMVTSDFVVAQLCKVFHMDVYSLKSSELDFPQLLMEDAQKGGLSQVKKENNRKIIFR